MSCISKRIVTPIVALVLSFAGSGCNPEKEAVPDPGRTPKPRVSLDEPARAEWLLRVSDTE